MQEFMSQLKHKLHMKLTSITTVIQKGIKAQFR